MRDDDKPGVRRAYQADYIFWLKKDQWDVAEAAMLFAGFEPEEFPDGDSTYSALASETDGIHRLIADDIASGKLAVKNSPGNWIDWLMQTGHPLKPELEAVLLRRTGQETIAAPVVTSGASDGAEPASAGPAPIKPKQNKRRTWQDVTWTYLENTFKAGQYATAKEFFKALENKAGAGSPFDKGEGVNRGTLYVREISESLALKTIQNQVWPKLKNNP